MKRQLATSCLFLLQCLSTAVASNSNQPTATPSTFIIKKFITYNMGTTIYWTPTKNSKNHTITYDIEYRHSNQAWTSFHCPRWYADSGDLACLFLTCNDTVLDVFYEVRIRARNLSSNVSAVTPSTVHNPSDEGIPLHIHDVNVTAISSSTVVVHWNLPKDFCLKASYCMKILYHNDSNTKNETASVSRTDKANKRMEITNLYPCSEYSFYLRVYQTELCSFTSVLDSSTTGPYKIVTPRSEPITSVVNVHNFDATILWSYPKRCLGHTGRFLVLFKGGSVTTWQKSSCTIVWNSTVDQFSCLLLTCNSVKDQSYEIMVKLANTIGERDNTLYFHPFFRNIPSKIRNVEVQAISSDSLVVFWKLPSTFCSKFLYCIRLCYNETSVTVADNERQNQSRRIHNLAPYTKYTFYMETVRPTLGCGFYSSQCTNMSTGPFIGTTLEAAPSKPPVVICGLCDVTEDDLMKRSGVVKWKLPPKNTWNGLPRLFAIEWQVKPLNSSLDDNMWYSKTLNQTLATACALGGLDFVEYVVRVRMCNGVGRCSVFSKEMAIEAKVGTDVKKPLKSNNLALSIGLPVASLVLIFAILVFLKKSRVCSMKRTTADQLPHLGAEEFSYENVAFPVSMQYSQLSPKDDKCSLASNDPKETTGHVQLNGDDVSTTGIYVDTK